MLEPVDEERDYGAHGDFDDRAKDFSYQLWIDQRRDWVLLAGLAGAVCGAACEGLGRAWRGGLAGLALGGVGTLALGAATRGGLRNAPRVPEPPHLHHGEDVSAETAAAK